MCNDGVITDNLHHDFLQRVYLHVPELARDQGHHQCDYRSRQLQANGHGHLPPGAEQQLWQYLQMYSENIKDIKMLYNKWGIVINIVQQFE